MNTNDALSQDTQLTQAVSRALQANETTAHYLIEVEAVGTTVSLLGTVGRQRDKETAERIARGVSGVIDVTNELVIDETGGAAQFGFLDNRGNNGTL